MTRNVSGRTLSLINAWADTTLVRGNHDAVGYSGGAAQTLTDMGNGTSIAISGNTQLTIRDFQHDPTGVVRLPYETTAPILQSDGNGGTLLTTGAGASVDFVGAVVPTSQIISSVPVTMAFVAPAAPTPAPAPTPDPPAPAAPSGTVHYVLGDAYFSANDGNANNGDTFNLLADHAILSVYGLANTMIFVWQANDNVFVTNPTGPTTVDDKGTGTTLTVAEDNDPSLQQLVSVMGFENDPTAIVHVSGGGALFWWREPKPTITPDGARGSLVVNAVGRAFVDLVGDPPAMAIAQV